MNPTAEVIADVTSALTKREAPGRDEIDSLAQDFIAAERAASEAYKIALQADQPHERLKERLILEIDEFGETGGPHTKVLRGWAHEVVIRRCLSSAIDQQAVRDFAHKVRGNRSVCGIQKDLFRCTISWELHPESEAFLRRFKLPAELQQMYERCRKIDSVPTLEVIPMRS
jgi:hypothetical protein